MTETEREFHAALGTTPYLLDILSSESQCAYDIINCYIKVKKCPDMVVGAIMGIIMGGLAVSVSLADIDRIINSVRLLVVKGKWHSTKIDWESLCKELKEYFKNKEYK